MTEEEIVSKLLETGLSPEDIIVLSDRITEMVSFAMGHLDTIRYFSAKGILIKPYNEYLKTLFELEFSRFLTEEQIQLMFSNDAPIKIKEEEHLPNNVLPFVSKKDEHLD